MREYLPEGLSVTDAANHLGITRFALSRILNYKAGISTEMDLLLADALGTTAGFGQKFRCNMKFIKPSKKLDGI